MDSLPKQVSPLGRVLVVDDEESLTRALCAQLQEHGYAAVGAPSGGEALAAMQEQQFELLLCDLLMPGMDGTALLKACLESDPHLVGVMMTGQGTVQSAVEAMKQGACDYLLKPFKMAELLPVLAKALELRRLRLENINLRQTLGLYELTTTLRFTQDLNTILDKTAEAALQQLGVDEVSVMLPTQGGKELFVAAVRGGQREHLLGRQVPYGEGIAGWVAHHREFLALDGPALDGRFGKIYTRPEIGTSLSLPMLAAGQLVGVLNLNDNTRRRTFTPGEIKALQLLTSIAAEALEANRSSEQAREAESQYRAIFDNAVVGVFQTTPEGRFLKANLAQARMLGYGSPEELIAAISDLGSQVYVSGEGRDEFKRRLEAEGKVQGFEIEARRRDGSTLWMLMSARAFRNAEGATYCYEGMVEDITERKKTEETLKLFRTLIDRSNDAIEVLDPETGRFLDINEKGCLDLGYSREEMLALSVFDIDPTVDQASFARAGEELRKSGSRLWEGRHRRKNGSTFPVEVNLNYVQLDRNYTVAVVRDITERKRTEAERHLQSAALQSADSAIVITDGAGAIEWINPAFTRLTGYALADVIGKNLLLESGRHEPAFYQSLWETILSGQVWRGETINRRKDGSFYTESQIITPVLDESGTIAHFVAIKEDISARLQLQAQLHQSQKMEALGQLAGGVAHDFNNLITVIDGYSRLALRYLPQEDSLLRSAVQEVQRAGERAEALVRQLLAFSRRESSARQILDLNQMVSGVEKMLRRLIGEDIALEVRLAPEAGSVEADPGQLEQVLMNLVVNARDAMPEGGQLIIETAACQLDEMRARGLGLEVGGQYCRLSVHDTGVGMSAEVQQHIFEPFFTTKEAGKGTGLGLSTVYGIVKEHRGGIQVRSQQGKGTCFEIYLPVAAAGGGQEGARQGQGSVPCGAETILVVEDDPSVRQFVVHTLGGVGYTVLEAEQGYTALQHCGSYLQPIALLLTDLVLPDVNGYALAAQVGVLRSGMKVLYMSGYAGRKGLPQGAEVNFLAKPFTPEGLARAVRQALDSAPPK